MIIVNLTGGLGNQMFQYAFGKTIAAKHRTSLKVHFTNALLNIQRSYELDVFKISANLATVEDLERFGIAQSRVLNRLLYLFDERYGIQLNKHIKTQRYPFIFDSRYLSIGDNSYIQGYWANERYFKGMEDIIRKEFTPKKKLDKKNKNILKQIQDVSSVSIHVRRADYITNKTNIPQFIGLDYYVNAIKEIKEKVSNPVFFVFSDDIAWSKKNLARLSRNMYFISHNKGRNSYKDMLLMSACKHNIIANSTFSWWGGWLNKNKDKITVKPH